MACFGRGYYEGESGVIAQTLAPIGGCKKPPRTSFFHSIREILRVREYPDQKGREYMRREKMKEKNQPIRKPRWISLMQLGKTKPTCEVRDGTRYVGTR